MRPVHTAFYAFNRGFDRLAAGYSGLVRGVIDVTPLMLLIYSVLLAGAGWLLVHTPTGFIPKMDRGVITVSLQLPPGASLSRTDEVVRRANAMVLEVPGVAHTSTYSGRSGSTGSNSSNVGAIFAIIDDPRKRAAEGLTIDKIAEIITARLNEIEESKTFVFIPPPVRGMGGQTGFSMRLQNRRTSRRTGSRRSRPISSGPPIAHLRDHQRLHDLLDRHPADLRRRRSRQGAKMLKVPRIHFEALRVYWGSAYVNDFNMFGRTFRVTAQADARFRVDPENIARIRVRNETGQMVPIGNLVTFRNIAGPDRMPRYNLSDRGGERKHRAGDSAPGRP